MLINKPQLESKTPDNCDSIEEIISENCENSIEMQDSQIL